MANIKDVNAIADKWSRVTPSRVAEYSAGVAAPSTSWAAATAAAEPAYKAGVENAVAKGTFKKGVNAAGDQKWQTNTQAKGPQRFAEGVAMAGPAYAEGFGPYASVIANTQLPPRYTRGDPRNLDRVKAISTALNKRRSGGK